MQKSTSFSDVRNGKPRPANLLAPRSGPSESLPWPSPSFDVRSSATPRLNTSALSADPGRPSTQVMSSSPTDGLPPTPLTATYKPLPVEGDRSARDGTSVRLPGVKDILALTPPESHESTRRTVPLPMEVDDRFAPARPQHFSSVSRAAEGGMPISPAHFRSMPQSEEVQGLGLDLGVGMTGEETPRMGSQDWAMRTPTMTAAPRMPGAPHLSSVQSGRLTSMVTSPIQPPLHNWNTDLRFAEERTPYFAVAPEQNQRPTMGHRSFSEQSTRHYAPMEREHAMALEEDMPQASKSWGLAISLDNGACYRRGNYLYRPDGSIVGPAAMVRSATGSYPASRPLQAPASSSASASATSPPTPRRPTVALPSSASRSASTSSTAAAPSTTAKQASTNTGLTPHIHKIRLTPSFSTRKTSNSSTASPAAGTESPSLKMKSKQRSEQLRNQAASVVAQANLPSEHASVLGGSGVAAGSASPTSSSLSSSSSSAADIKQSEAFSPSRSAAHSSPTASPIGAPLQSLPVANSPAAITMSPRKRQLRVLDSNTPMSRSPSVESCSKQVEGTAGTASPWGVFELGSTNKWQPLGPPALSNVLGKLNLDEAGGDDDDGGEDEYDDDDDTSKTRNNSKAKRARKMGPAKAASVTRQRSASPYKRASSRSGSVESGENSEEKENDVFGSMRRTPVIGAHSSPNRATPGQRRLLSIR